MIMVPVGGLIVNAQPLPVRATRSVQEPIAIGPYPTF